MACETVNIKDELLKQLINKYGQKEGMKYYLQHNIGDINANELLKDNIFESKVAPKPEEIQYELKTVNILSNLTDKGKVEFAKLKNSKTTIEKVVDNLQIPKEQKQLVIDSYNEGNKTPEQLAIDIASKYSYSVEVKTALAKPFNEDNYQYAEEQYDLLRQGLISQEEYDNKTAINRNPSQYYANLSVPGGTNYTENRIITPQIVPSIKGHANFAEKNDVGWSRSDDRVTYNIEHIDFVMNELEKSGQLKIKCD